MTEHVEAKVQEKVQEKVLENGHVAKVKERVDEKVAAITATVIGRPAGGP